MPIFKTKNNDFFKQWSPEMAYVLGYFAADGCMIKNKRGAYYIEFISTDRELIKGLRTLFKSNHKIGIKPKKNDRCMLNYRLQIGSKIVFSDLLKLGFLPNKSKVIKLPLIPSGFFNHFVRGYFDGDGNVYYGKYKPSDRVGEKTVFQVNFVSGSPYFLPALQKRLKREAGLHGGTLYFAEGYRLSYSKYDSIRFLNFIYRDVGKNLFLKRKFNYSQKYLSTINYHYNKSLNGPVAQLV